MEKLQKELEEIKEELAVEEVIVKLEPKDLPDPIQVMELRDPSKKRKRASENTFPKYKSKASHGRRRQTIHESTEEIKPTEDLNSAENSSTVLDSTETASSQCRFCMRQTPPSSLKKVRKQHEDKAQDAFQVLPNVTYPFACYNCLNLLDMFIDFKDAVVKAEKLLQSEASYLKCGGWAEPDFVEAVARCKKTVQLHRKQVDKLYKNKFEPQEELPVPIVHEKPKLRSSEVVLVVVPQETIQEVIKDEIPILVTSENTAELPRFRTRNETKEQQKDPVVEDLVSSAEDFSDDDDEYKPEELNETNDVAKSEDDSIHDDHENMVTTDEDDTDEYEAPKPKIPKTKEPKTKEPKPKQPREPKSKETKTSKTKQKKPKKVYPKKIYPKKFYPKKRELCHLCGEAVGLEAVEDHKNRHLGIRPYTCTAEGCGSTFYGQYNLTLHMRRLHSAKGMQARECNVCGKFIRGRPSDLKNHQRLHEIKEKDYVCQECGKAFTTKAYLRQHSNSHGEFPHKCSYCGKRFNNKWSMKAHEKNIHEKRLSVSTVPEQTMAVVNNTEAAAMVVNFESFQ